MSRLIVIGHGRKTSHPHPFDEISQSYQKRFAKVERRLKRMKTNMQIQMKSLDRIDKEMTRSLKDITTNLAKYKRADELMMLNKTPSEKKEKCPIGKVARKLTRQMSLRAGESFLRTEISRSSASVGRKTKKRRKRRQIRQDGPYPEDLMTRGKSEKKLGMRWMKNKKPKKKLNRNMSARFRF